MPHTHYSKRSALALKLRAKKKGDGKIAVATAVGEAQKKAIKKFPAGEGGRFAALKANLAKRKGIKTPGALAAFIGRRKFGNKKFQAMAAAGKK